MNTEKKIVSVLALAITGCFFITSCNNEDLTEKAPPQPAEVIGIYNNPNTRTVSNNTLTSFSLYVFDEYYGEGGGIQANNILWTLNNNKWSGSKAYYMSTWAAMNGYGISPNTDDVTNPVFDNSEQSFTYTDPTEKGVLLKIASKLYFTKEETNNSLILTFNDALYTIRFQAISGFQNVKVEVKEITIHNVPNQARFTFNQVIESTGNWTLTTANQYVSASQTLPSAVTVIGTKYADISNEPFVLFPIQPDEWDYWGDESLDDAKARNCCYIEVKMRITEDDPDVPGKKYYLWGYADDDPNHQDEIFESAFYPYEQENCTAQWKMRYNGYYYLFLDDNGVNKDGYKIKPHPEEGGSSNFSVSAQIDFRTLMNQQNSTADPWEVETEGKTVDL